MAMRDAFEGCKGSGVAGGTSPDVREGRWRADYPMIQINAVALLAPIIPSMAFDPRKLSILEVALTILLMIIAHFMH
jgi:hypothetical protein